MAVQIFLFWAMLAASIYKNRAQIQWATTCVTEGHKVTLKCPHQRLIQVIDTFSGVGTANCSSPSPDCLYSLKSYVGHYHDNILGVCQWKRSCSFELSAYPTLGTPCYSSSHVISDSISVEYECLVEKKIFGADGKLYSRCNGLKLDPQCPSIFPSNLLIKDAFYGVLALSTNCNQSTASDDDFLVRIKEKNVTFHDEIIKKCSGRSFCEDVMAKQFSVDNLYERYKSDYVMLVYECEKVIADYVIYSIAGGAFVFLLVLSTILWFCKRKRRVNQQTTVTEVEEQYAVLKTPVPKPRQFPPQKLETSFIN